MSGSTMFWETFMVLSRLLNANYMDWAAATGSSSDSIAVLTTPDSATLGASSETPREFLGTAPSTDTKINVNKM